MEVKKNIELVYTKEEILSLLREVATKEGYSFEDKAVTFVGKAGRKLTLKKIVINGSEVDGPAAANEEASEDTPEPETKE